MAGNFEKFIDRTPIICAAGKPSGDPKECVRRCLQMYSVQDQVDALKHDGQIWEHRREPFKYKLPKLENRRHQGIYTEGRALIRPPDRTNYQELINDLKETSYASYWNKVLGKSRDPVPGLPAGMEPLEVTFGKKSEKSIAAKEVVNPPKTVYEVLYDSQVGRELYKKTHDDYNPGEQINRKYKTPPYNPDKRFGKRSGFDPRGIWVRCACHWHRSEPVTSAKAIQADILERTKPLLGKTMEPNKNIDCVPKGFLFGKPSNRPMCGVEELLRDPDCPPCVFKRDFYDLLTALNTLRDFVKHKNPFIFDKKYFRNRILYYDKEQTGWIPVETLYEVCGCYGLDFEHKYLEPLFYMFGIFVEGQADYDAFLNILDCNQPMPELFKIEDVPLKNLYYITTYQASACDHMMINNAVKPPAGLPSTRYDLIHSSKPEGGCLADIDHFGDEISAGSLINPSIYTNYGVSHRDFLMPRSADFIKKLFKNAGWNIPDEIFDKLWKIGIERDKNGGVCVDTFKTLLNENMEITPAALVGDDKC